MPKNMPNIPGMEKPQSLVKAKLIDHSGNLKKRWYINIFLRDTLTGEIVRYRISEKINKYTNEAQRRSYAQLYIHRLTQMLATGYHFTKKTKFDLLDVTTSKTDISQLSLQDAILKFLEYNQTASKATLNRYRATQKYLAEMEAKHKPLLLQNVEASHIAAILKHFQSTRNISPKTYNHYRSTFFAVCNHFVKLGVLARNPVALVPVQRVQKGKMHFPLTLEEVSRIKSHALSLQDHQFVLFMSLCFYALIRPGKELRLMKVRDIDTNTIWVTAENAKTDESRRVEMVSALRKIVEAYHLEGCNPNHYIFTRTGRPGSEPVGPGYFYKKQKRYLKAVGLSGRGHDLYCYKHSGAIQMIKSGFTPFEIMKMAGHKNVQQTMDYLYNIGAISRLGDKANNMPDF